MPTATEFNPYRLWLDVRDASMPPNPYELLGLPALEKDPGKIRSAIERKRAMLDDRRVGAQSEIWEQVDRELENAIASLLDPQQKTILDAAIKRRTKNYGALPPVAANDAAGFAARAEVACTGCKRENPATRRFCASCGESLWQKCPKCSAECSADERFCGTCGTDIQDRFAAQNAQYQSRFEEALDSAANCRYDAALSVLRSLAAIEDARFESWALKAIDEIARLEKERSEHTKRAAQALVSAREMMASHSYDKALQILAEVDERLRTSEINDLMQRAQLARDELLSLGRDIRTAMEEKRTWDLLPKLERLLALRPNHAQAQQLAAQLRDQFVKQALKKLGEHKYSEAVRALEQIPFTMRTEEADVLADKATELERLIDAVRFAALADQATLALAEKLAKAAPSNAEALALRQQLLERMKAPVTDTRTPLADFAPRTHRSRLGPPVDWLGCFARLTGHDEKIVSTLRDQPGQFFVALGLALQGASQASISFNLAPPEKAGMLSKLSMSLVGRRGAVAAWGFDLSESGLKAIKLSYDPKSQTSRIEACEHLLHHIPLNHPEAKLLQGEICDATLKAFCSRHDVGDAKICLAVPGHRVLGRFFDLPPMPAKKVADAVLFEAQHQFPIPLEELRWAYHIQDEAVGKAADEQTRRIMVVAARQAHVQERIQMLDRAGIAVDIVQSECIALHNAAVFEFFPEASSASCEAVALVDVGAESTNVVVSTARSTWFRSFCQGGSTCTSAILRQLQLTHEQAEQLKREPARARRYHLLQAAATPFLVQMCSEIERSLITYQKTDPDRKIRHVYGLGGGFQQHGLLRYLRSAR